MALEIFVRCYLVTTKAVVNYFCMQTIENYFLRHLSIFLCSKICLLSQFAFAVNLNSCCKRLHANGVVLQSVQNYQSTNP